MNIADLVREWQRETPHSSALGKLSINVVVLGDDPTKPVRVGGGLYDGKSLFAPFYQAIPKSDRPSLSLGLNVPILISTVAVTGDVVSGRVSRPHNADLLVRPITAFEVWIGSGQTLKASQREGAVHGYYHLMLCPSPPDLYWLDEKDWGFVRGAIR